MADAQNNRDSGSGRRGGDNLALLNLLVAAFGVMFTVAVALLGVVLAAGEALSSVARTGIWIAVVGFGGIGVIGFTGVCIALIRRVQTDRFSKLARLLLSHRLLAVASVVIIAVLAMLAVAVNHFVFGVSPVPVQDLSYVEHVLYLGNDHHLHDASGDATTKGPVAWEDSDLTRMAGPGNQVSGKTVVGFASDADQHAVFLNDRQHVRELTRVRGWSSADLTTLANAPPTIAGSSLAAYATSEGQDVFYIGTDANVRDLHWDRTAWTVVDFAATAGAVSAAPDSPLATYAVGGSLKVVYLDGSHHVRQLFGDPQGWHTQDLTAAASAVSAAAGSTLAAYVRGDVESILYLDDHGDVHQLRGDATGWHGYDLTSGANAPAAAQASPLTAYVWQSTPRIFYTTIGGDVQELWADGNGWHEFDLTELAGPGASTGGVGAFTLDGLEHVTFLATNGDLAEVTHVTGDGLRWVRRNPTRLAQAVHPLSGSAVSDVVIGDTQSVFYFGSDGHARDLQWHWPTGTSNRGLSADVTAVARTSAIGRGSSLVTSRVGNLQHVFYTASDEDVHELRLVPTGIGSAAWQDEDITKSVGTRGPAAGSHLTGYVMGVSQHILYIDPAGDVRELWSEWAGQSWTGWHWNDLTLQAQAPVAVQGSSLTSYVINDVAHVIFVDGGGHLFDLSYAHGAQSSGWKAEDVTALAGAARAPSDTDLTASVLDGAQFVDYLDGAGHVVQLLRDPADGVLSKTASKGWHPPTDLMVSADAPAAGQRSSLVSLTVGRTRHLMYVDRGGHPHDLSNDGSGWQAADIGSRAEAPRADTGTPLVASPTDGVERVLYRDRQGAVIELVKGLNGGWQMGDVTAETGALAPASWSGIVGAGSDGS
jgi:hypothetical protein